MATDPVNYIIKALADKTLTMADIANLVMVAQDSLGVRSDGMPGARTLAKLRQYTHPGFVLPSVAPPDKFVDRRAFHVPHFEKDGKSFDYTPSFRDWTNVRGVCLHQTACDLGMKVERYNTIGAHFAVLRDGTVLQMCDLNRIVYHGNGWNNQTVGIEINGLFAGVENDPTTLWDDPSTPQHEVAQTVTPEQIAATKQLIRWLKAEVERNGGHLTKLVAHRQSSKDRRDDPGSKVWKEIALPMHKELGLDDGGPGFEIGGYPIPETWDPSRKGIKY